MSTARRADSLGRLHVVLVPGFAGFDALGQLEYYAGVTDAYRRWCDKTAKSRRRAVVLHYFDNLPTAAVATRAERLRAYLAKRIARGEIQTEDKIALVGHSTGGLDIRRMLFAKENTRQERVLHLDGGDRSDSTARLRGAVRTAVEVRQSDICRAVDCLVFLSVPQWGTNIADWTRNHGPLRCAVVEELHLAVEAARRPRIDQALTGVLGQVGYLVHDPDIVLAAQDALRESTAPLQPPGPRADAEQAGSQLRLWLQHAVDDFAAINDLTSEPAGRFLEPGPLLARGSPPGAATVADPRHQDHVVRDAGVAAVHVSSPAARSGRSASRTRRRGRTTTWLRVPTRRRTSPTCPPTARAPAGRSATRRPTQPRTMSTQTSTTRCTSQTSWARTASGAPVSGSRSGTTTGSSTPPRCCGRTARTPGWSPVTTATSSATTFCVQAVQPMCPAASTPPTTCSSPAQTSPTRCSTRSGTPCSTSARARRLGALRSRPSASAGGDRLHRERQEAVIGGALRSRWQFVSRPVRRHR